MNWEISFSLELKLKGLFVFFRFHFLSFFAFFFCINNTNPQPCDVFDNISNKDVNFPEC